ncbi:MAG: hypothetical protein D6791_15115 [Chloroflexi bacterium]|nr:MAG: hypothetical protein D6791_15115 [Chloroflexota bacterium]
MSDPSWLEELNERQREAVTYRPAPLLVLAGPGSGKTRILTHRIAWLVEEHKARPEHILAVTFTNRAAEEMRSRLQGSLGAAAANVWVYTFHATAVRILRRFGTNIGLDPQFAIIDEDDQRHLVKRALRHLGVSREMYPVYQVLDYISRRKNALLDPVDLSVDSDPVLVDLARSYEAWLKENHALDFDDLIRYAVALLRQHDPTREHFHRTLKHILVDEYQDIDPAQYELLKLLAPPGASITVVADDDQSIYGWRGSQPQLIDAFIERYHPHIVKLEWSYRCPPAILYGAQRLITHQRSQERQRFMRSQQTSDMPIFHYIFHNVEQEQRWLVSLIGKLIEERGYKPGDIGILYRTHRLAGPVEQTLLQAGFKVHRLRKESFFEEPIIRDIIRYLQLARFWSEENFSAAVNFPRRWIDELTMLQLRRLAATEETSIMDVARRCDEYSEISPLTRAHLRRFLAVLDDLALKPDTRAETAVSRAFERLDILRSPWREGEHERVQRLMTLADLHEEADRLAEAIEAERRIVVVHPDTLEGHVAAFILQTALDEYLDTKAETVTGAAVDASAWNGNTAFICLGEVPPSLLDYPIIPIPSPEGSAGRFPLSVCAWRCAQSLLAGYETLADGRFVVIDVETTGTNLRRDEIVEMAAAVYEDQQMVEPPFHRLVCPVRGYIPRAASRVHGIYYEDVENAPHIAQVLPEFLDYIDDDILVGHNISRFDNRFIDKACAECFEGKGFHPHYVDTLRLARRLIPGLPRYSLEALLKTLELGEVVEHRAQADLMQTAELFFYLAERIVDEKEQEALSELLPLVGLGIMAAGREEDQEMAVLLNSAARVLTSPQASIYVDRFLASLPLALQTDSHELTLKLEAREIPVNDEDELWAELRETFLSHIEAFERYSPDPSLAAFLDYQALLSSIDTFAHEHDDEHITMMTLHNAKGTEFPVVIIIGVEQENLPLWHTLDDPQKVAEERRVLYVGITRAKEACYLFSTWNRNDGFRRSPSRFAFEIPAEYVRRFKVDAKNRVTEL